MEKLDYKKKCLALFGVLVLFFYLGYKFSFSDTFEIADKITEKEEKLSWLKNKEMELPILRTKMMEFEKAYSSSDSIGVRDKLTACISDFAEEHHCLVTEIPSNSSFNNKNLRIQTNSFTIRGDFYNLLSLLSMLERDYKYVAKIMSTKFFSIKDGQARTKNLYLTIVTQSFQQKIVK